MEVVCFSWEYVQILTAIIQAPIVILKDSIKNKEWFKGIILSTVLLEVFGRWKLQAEFEGKIKPERFDHFGFEQIIMFLFASKLIDHPTYTRMMEVRKMRNDIAHRLWKGLSLDQKQAKSTINKAIKCLKNFGLPETKNEEK